jgi:nucleoid-associated protein YgaU
MAIVVAVGVVVFGALFGLRLVQGSPAAVVAADAAGPAAGQVAVSLPAGGSPVVGPGDQIVIAEAGDSLWSIARSVAPEGDLRPVVAALVEANQGDSVQIGQQIVIPRQLLD